MISVFIEKLTFDINKIFDVILIKEIIAPFIIIISGLIIYKVINALMKRTLNLKVYKIEKNNKNII